MGEGGGRRLRCNASFGEILLIGEHLRILMHTEAGLLVRDHRLLFRTHACCFLASEALDWLVRVGQTTDRATGIFLMNVLVQKDIIHHVTDTQIFADNSSLFRFRQDDGTYPWFNDLAIYLQGLQRYNRCKSIRQTEDGDTVRGDELVSWMVQNGEAGSREDAVREARHMLESHIIRHTRDEQHFRDEPLLYHFPKNFGRKRTLLDLLKPAAESPEMDELSVPLGKMTVAQDIPLCRDVNRAESGYHSDNVEACCSSSSQGTSPLSAEQRMQTTPGDGVIIRKATISELEYPNSPFKKRRIRIASDAVGFGFVIRGEGPVFVKTVDPTGPAAASGLKVGHFIYSVNGEKALHSNHRDLAHVILDSTNQELYVTLVVMEHENDIQP